MLIGFYHECLPGAAGPEIEENADFLVGERGDGETDTAPEDGAFVEGIFPLERDLYLVTGDLLLETHNLVIVTGKDETVTELSRLGQIKMSSQISFRRKENKIENLKKKYKW